MDVINVTGCGGCPSPPLVLVLAAGAGTRMGGPKLFARIHGSAFCTHIARTLQPFGWPVVWVLRSQSQLSQLTELIGHDPDICINPNPEGDMLSSVLAGMRGPQARFAPSFCIWPVDFPLIRPETLHQLVSGLQTCDAVLPSKDLCTGLPMIVTRHALARWLSTLPQHGLRQAMRENPGNVRGLPVTDPGPFWNLNTPEACLAAEAAGGQ